MKWALSPPANLKWLHMPVSMNPEKSELRIKQIHCKLIHEGHHKGKNILYISRLMLQLQRCHSCAFYCNSDHKEGPHTKWNEEIKIQGNNYGVQLINFSHKSGKWCWCCFSWGHRKKLRPEASSSMGASVSYLYVRWQQVKAQFISLVMQGQCFHDWAPTGQHSPPWFVILLLSFSKCDASEAHPYLGHRVLLHSVCARWTTQNVKGLLKERNWLKMHCLAYLGCDVVVSCRVVKVPSADSRKLILLLQGNCSQRFLSTEGN